MTTIRQPHKLYAPTEALIRRGQSDTDIGLVLGGNFRHPPSDVFG
jgi:microsomal dipeptidase-like Zn-dependent dipeptidase